MSEGEPEGGAVHKPSKPEQASAGQARPGRELFAFLKDRELLVRRFLLAEVLGRPRARRR